MRTLDEATDDAERKAIQDISRFGCHVLNVFDPDGALPDFAYSVGIASSTGAPEAIVVGLKRELGASVINTYNDRVRAGHRFSAGDRSAGFIEGFDVEFRTVHLSQIPEYFGWTLWWSADEPFTALQIIFPTTSGIWPWEPEASDWFRQWQPLLEQPFVPESAQNDSTHR